MKEKKHIFFRKMLLYFIINLLILGFATSCGTLDNSVESSDSVGLDEEKDEVTETATDTATQAGVGNLQVSTTPLFEDIYYAVLPGENQWYNVYDSYGNYLTSFEYVGDVVGDVTGFYKKEDICGTFNFYSLKTFPFPENFDGFINKSPDGSYWSVDNSTGEIVCFKENGDLAFDLKADKIMQDTYMLGAVLPLGENYLVFSYDSNEGIETGVKPKIVDKNGKLVQSLEELFKSGNMRGTLADSYIIVQREYSEDDMRNYYDLYDLNGNMVQEDITPVVKISYNPYEFEAGNYGYMVCDNYILNYNVYNEKAEVLGTVKEQEYPSYYNTYQQYGDYIEGLPYYYQDILCDQFLTGGWGNSIGGVYGYNGETLGFISDAGKFTMDFSCDSVNIYYANKSFVIINTYTGDTRLDYLYSFEKQDVINTLSDSNSDYSILAENYIISNNWGDNNASVEISVIDKDGVVRYNTSKNAVMSTYGDYMVLQRGPYIGIADLDGNWIMKTINPIIATDNNLDYYGAGVDGIIR